MRIRFVLCCLLASLAGAAWPASITIDATKPGVKVSPAMYGLFFEEINHSGDGGMYAEMVRNRSFEDYRPVEGAFPMADGWYKIPGAWRNKPDMTNDGLIAWSLVNADASTASIALDKSVGLNSRSSSSLRLEVSNVKAPGAGIANEGYWGMYVKAGDSYNFSFYVKSKEPYAGKLAAFLESSGGKIISNRITASRVGPDWQKISGTFKGTGNDPKARLVVLADAPGTLWFDCVSLFPAKTWKNRPNGFRQDIGQMLADIKPGFVRWPGGCIVEGISLANGFYWKDTIGPIEQRPGKYNLWGYRRTDGFGYLEFLQYCEDLGAEPLLVVNCGISCQWRAPSFAPVNDLDYFIEQALDAIEYANGPVTSKWGAVRAAAGHPKPFNLRYLEIGNENWGTEYADRYIPFYEAVKKKYPEIICISDNVLPGMKMEINDEHYYNKPEFFLQNANKYDSYDRNAHKVFIGEIACTEGTGKTGNLRAMLGEASFLIGAERNADVVELVSYAPLLCNVNNRVWSPDLISYDTSRTFGNPSYYLYTLLGTNRPDETIPTTAEGKAVNPVFPGKIGIGTIAGTTSEFKDIKVEKDGKILFQSDFNNGTDGWDLNGGKWDVVDGCLRQEREGKAIAGDSSWFDYTLTCKARKISGSEGFIVCFTSGAQGDNVWNVGGWGNTQSGLQGPLPEDTKPLKLDSDRWYDVKVELKGASIKCYLDGKLIHDIERPVYGQIFAVAGKENKSGDIIVKIANPTNEALSTDVKLLGVKKVAPTGTETVLASSDPWDENSLDNPTKVAPVTSKITGLGKEFTYTVKPYSFTVLRLKTK